MSEASDFDRPSRRLQPWASRSELALWTAIVLACTAPLQVLLDQEGRPGTVLVTGLAAVAALGLLLRKAGVGAAYRLARVAWPFLLAIAAMGVFALGAADSHWSLVRWLTWLPCVVAAACLTARLAPHAFVSATLAALAIAMALSCIVALAWPAYGAAGAAGVASGEGPAGAWSGVYRTKNALGHVAGVALALTLVFGRRWIRAWPTLLAAAAAAGCLTMARSASGVAIAAALLCLCLGLRGRGVGRWVVLALAGGLGIAVLAGGGLDAAAGWLGRDATLTGRTAIWRAAWPYALQDPVMGLGYDFTGSSEMSARLRAMFDVYSVHSGYLDALICLGFGGCVLLAGAMIWAVWRAWSTRSPTEPRRGLRRSWRDACSRR